MLKKIALGSIFASVLALTYIQSTASVQDQSELTKENIEALAFFDKIEEWWNRKDYTCVSVTCECIMYDYKSEVASAVDERNLVMPPIHGIAPVVEIAVGFHNKHHEEAFFIYHLSCLHCLLQWREW